MHSRFVSIFAVAGIILLPIFWITRANAEYWFGGQEILIECPIWEWEASQISGIGYEICFDDVDHCTVAEIGDSVCIPSLGNHDVWVTAVDDQGAEPIYYDGDVVTITRAPSADFDGNDIVGFPDFGLFGGYWGEGSGSLADFDGDGIVGFLDFTYFSSAFGKCVHENGTVYDLCP
jgi:hypothetical protein